MLYKLRKILNDLETIHSHIRDKEKEYNELVNLVVGLHTTYRLDEQYSISDKVREVLNQSGIRIIQGTIGHSYEDIPEKLKGRQYNDTWEKK